MRYFVTIDDRALEVDIGPDGVSIDGEPVPAALESIAGTDAHRVRIGDRSHRVAARRAPDGRWLLHVDGRPAVVEVVDERTRTIRALSQARAEAAGPKPLRAPMPGLVVRIEVAEGDEVAVGQGLVIVEAMKMENELRADAPARVARILVTPGQAVEKDQVLIDLEAVESGEGGAAVEARDAEDAR